MLSELQKQLNGVVYTIKACMQSPTRSNLNCVQVDRTEARLAQHICWSRMRVTPSCGEMWSCYRKHTL